MNKSIFLVAIFAVLNCYIAHSQLELKFYTGLLDQFGLALEFDINEKTGFEIGGSFNSREGGSYFSSNFNVGLKEKDIFINSKFKRYINDGFLKSRAFLGAYLRYRQFATISSDRETWSPSALDYANNNNVLLSRREHKLSIGALFGMKGKLFKSLSWEVTTGIGGSPSFLYTYHSVTSQGNEKGEVGPDEGDWGIGYLNHLSLLGHIGIGYKF